MSTQIHTVVDALGNPVRRRLTPGQRHDITQAHALLEGLNPQAVVADKACDAQEFIESLDKTGAQAVIPPRDKRTETRDYDRHLYKDRNLVERFFNQIKQFRASPPAMKSSTATTSLSSASSALSCGCCK